MRQETKLTAGDVSTLLQVASGFAERNGCTASQAIDRIARMLNPETIEDARLSPVSLPQFVARLRRLRMRRNELFGAPLFRDPAWDMLLELFVAHEGGRQVSVSSLCYASGVPLTTALRQIARLEKHGLIERRGDKADNRRCLVSATPRAIRGIAEATALLIDQRGDAAGAEIGE